MDVENALCCGVLCCVAGQDRTGLDGVHQTMQIDLADLQGVGGTEQRWIHIDHREIPSHPGTIHVRDMTRRREEAREKEEKAPIVSLTRLDRRVNQSARVTGWSCQLPYGHPS